MKTAIVFGLMVTILHQSSSLESKLTIIKKVEIFIAKHNAALGLPTEISDDVVCPGGKKTCTLGQTCCLMNTGKYGCCAAQNAVCCSDRLHCCPSSSTCCKDGSCCPGLNAVCCGTMCCPPNYTCRTPYCIPNVLSRFKIN